MNPICLITPPSPFLLDQRVFASLGILRVASSLEAAGYPVEHLDLSGIDNYEEAVTDHMSRTGANIFGLTATTPQMPATMKIREVIKKIRPYDRIILGGPHVTLVNAAMKRELRCKAPGRAHRAFSTLLGSFSVLVCGDGEDAVLEAVKSDAKQVIDADDVSSTHFLTNARYNELPFPARHLIDMESYHYSIEGVPSLSLIAQLGCPFCLRILRWPRVSYAAQD